MGRTGRLVAVALFVLALPAEAALPAPRRGALTGTECDFIEKHEGRVIPPGGRFTLVYLRRLEAASLRLRVTVTVLPDEFYTRFFEALLTAGAGAGEAQIRETLEATRPSAYTLYEKELPVR